MGWDQYLGGMSGEEIYDNFSTGDAAALNTTSTSVNKIAERYNQRAESITVLMNFMREKWKGAASDAANVGAGPLERAHKAAAEPMITTGDLLSRQAGSFNDAKQSVIKVPPLPDHPMPWPFSVPPGEITNYSNAVTAHNEASQHNVDVMDGYEGASAFNTVNLPQEYGREFSSNLAPVAIVPGTVPSSVQESVDSFVMKDSSTAGTTQHHAGSDSFTVKPNDPPVHGAPGVPGLSTSPPGAGGSLTHAREYDQFPHETRPGPPPLPVSGSPADLPGQGGSPGGGVATRYGAGGGSGPGRGVPGGGAGVGGGEAVTTRGPAGRGSIGGLAAEESANGRGGRSGTGMPLGARGRGGRDEDDEHSRASYLIEADPEALFDTDLVTAPPVIGEE